MNQLFLMKDYPADVLPMYAQGYSVCQFLIDQKGPREFIRFLGNYLRHPSWTKNLKTITATNPPRVSRLLDRVGGRGKWFERTLCKIGVRRDAAGIKSLSK